MVNQIPQVPQAYDPDKYSPLRINEKTLPEYKNHADKLIYVNYYMKSQPSFFSPEEVQAHQRFLWYRKLSYVEIGIYLGFLILGRNPVQAQTNNLAAARPIFASCRQRFVFPRMLFLNLGLTTHLMAVYKESQLRNALAEKYFSNVQYASTLPSFATAAIPVKQSQF